MATINKQYILNMQMADGTTKSASFVIPVNQPTAAQVPCDEVWSKTLSWNYDGSYLIGGGTKTASHTFDFNAKITNPTVRYGKLPSAPGWSKSVDDTSITVSYSSTDTPSAMVISVHADLVPTVDNYLTYLYNNKK